METNDLKAFMEDCKQTAETKTYWAIRGVTFIVATIICAILSVAAIITQKGFWVFLGVLGLILEIIFVISEFILIEAVLSYFV